MALMKAHEAVIVREWLEKSRGEMTQEAVADAMIEAGYKMDRTRYGRYETGKLPIGPKVYANLVAFWKSRNIDPPSFIVPTPPLDPMERIALAVQDIARSLDLLRKDMATQSGAVVGEVRSLGERLTESLAGMRGA